MARRKVLLTGGSGFIGANVLESGLAGKFEFVSPSHGVLDLIDTDAVDAFFARHRFDAIVHAAVKPGHRNAKDPTALFYSNTRIYFNLARHAHEVERMIVLGSGAVYDPAHYLPRMREDYFGAHVPADEHGFCKYVCEKHLEASANIVDLRIFGIFGKYEDYAIRFISNMMCKCVFGLPLTVKQDRLLDYLHVDDLMPVLEHFLLNRPRHHAYNVTPDGTMSLLDLAHRIRAISGKDLPIVVHAPGRGPEYSGDNARLKGEVPGFKPGPLDAALAGLYRWYLERPHLIQKEALLMTNDKVKAKVADYIARRLAERHGVRHVFMVTGGGAMHLNDAVGKQAGLEPVCNHHEQACAIAAEAYARVSGRLAFVSVTSGPGATNTLTGVLGQWTDSVGVLYISGQIKLETSIHAQPGLALRQLGDQEVDITKVVAPITKYAATLRDPRQAKAMLDKAVALATSGRPGPVWLDVPLDVQGAMVSESEMTDYDPSEDAPTADRGAKISEVVAHLMRAQRPVILAGHGIRIARAQGEFLALVERLGVPVLSTFNGTDLIASGHPSYVGRVGTIGGRAGNFALQNSDLLVSIGSRNNIRQISYFWQSYARAAKKIVVDIDAAELKKHTLVPDLALLMDAGDFIRGLAGELEGKALPDWSPWRAWCAERKRKFPTFTAKPAAQGLDPYLFVAKLSAALAEGAIVVGGDGTASVAPFQAAQVKAGQRYIWNSGCASMGYDLPAAIGASFATDRGQVVCLAGDGSIMMNLQELETIAYQKLPIKIFLLNNQGYISIRQTQSAYFDRRFVGVDPSSGVGFPDFRKLAEAFGLGTERVTQDDDVDAKIAAVLKRAGPVLCEVMLPADYAFEPKLSSARLPDGRMVSKPLEDLSPLLDREEFRANMLIPVLEE